jgi:hypothetical protein
MDDRATCLPPWHAHRGRDEERGEKMAPRARRVLGRRGGASVGLPPHADAREGPSNVVDGHDHGDGFGGPDAEADERCSNSAHRRVAQAHLPQPRHREPPLQHREQQHVAHRHAAVAPRRAHDEQEQDADGGERRPQQDLRRHRGDRHEATVRLRAAAGAAAVGVVVVEVDDDGRDEEHWVREQLAHGEVGGAQGEVMVGELVGEADDVYHVGRGQDGVD